MSKESDDVRSANGLIAVIPAGGIGSRLWPLSRPDRPKFLLDLLGTGTTLIQDTVARLAPLADGVIVVTGQRHADAVGAQLPGVDAADILTEPSPRDSMAAIALAAAVIEHRHGPRVMGSFAADHVIRKPQAFAAAVATAAGAAAEGAVVVIGIEPTEPSTAFGYIRAAGGGAGTVAAEVLDVAAFTEKPDAQTAAGMIAAGGHFWNAGMYVVRTDVLLGHLARLQPGIHDGVRAIAAAWDTDGRDAAVAAHWDGLTKIAIDHAIAEPVAAQGGVKVVPADLDWHDIGDFAALAEMIEPGPDGVIRIGRDAAGALGAVATVDAHGAMVVGGDRPVAIVGLDNVTVVDTPEALLILGRHAAQAVKAANDAL